MKSIKHVLIGALLASAASFASATVQYGSAFVFPTFNDPDPTQTWMFDSTQVFDDNSNLIVASQNDSFVYDFWLNGLPPAMTFNFMLDPGNVGDITFTGAGMYNGDDGTTLAWPFTTTFTDSEVSGSGILNSGVYDLRIAGTFNVDNASFGGLGESTITDPVPEPMSLSLVGLGLAGMAGVRRRKAAKAA